MISSISVNLTRNSTLSKDKLEELAKEIYTTVEAPNRDVFSQGTDRYLEDISKFSVYTCIPYPVTQAIFLWHDRQAFEVIVRTFQQGNLLKSTEKITKNISMKLKEYNINYDLSVEITSTNDSQQYITGRTNFLKERLWEELKDNLAALIIGIIMAVIAKYFLDQYFQESIAGIISLVMFTIWEAFVIWNNAKASLIQWSIK
ncbi:hypothetical protein [Candidatus Oscillochloris fontis]|uniref:hypothetical protein n=1 Tax=Candidatus Oscillochloris fontis TaxID=2496868 RepID=UPI00101D975B|nr:hypothetical protein [Candidatus Oscillochloris fontis]